MNWLKLLKMKNKELRFTNITNFKTINDVQKANGIITRDVTIFSIEKKLNIFVIDKENFDYDLLAS